MIKLLPHWVLTDRHPAFYDSESGSILEQTRHMYGKIQELIEDYNKFVDEINKHMIEYEAGITESFECFKSKIIKTVEDYIQCVDLKLSNQMILIENKFTEIDEALKAAEDYMKTNLAESIERVVVDMKATGELDQAILDALGDFETRLADIETNYTSIDSRVTILENTELSIEYDEATESMSIITTIKEGE